MNLSAEIAIDCIQLPGGGSHQSKYAPHIYLKPANLNEVLLETIADMLEAT